MLLADCNIARQIDKNTSEQYGIPSSLLMENAGVRVADEALNTGADKFVVLAGKGNNGGDGSVAARHIFCSGKDVTLVLITDDIKGDALLMYKLAKSIGVDTEVGFTDRARSCINSCDVIIDALLGTGCKDAPSGIYRDIIEYVNGLDKYVLAVDVPSGINTSNGCVFDVAMKCRKTVTFGVGRLGLMLYPAKEYAGDVCVREISFAPNEIDKITVRTVEYKPCENITEDCHKGSMGKVLVAAGSVGMTGAACIASCAAIRAGAGVVSLCIPAFLNIVTEQKLTEVMTIPVDDNGSTISADAYTAIISTSKKYDTLVIGCGLGNNSDIRSLVNNVVCDVKCNIVIDADALNCIDKDILKRSTANIVITPHIGEMSRLTGKAADKIKADLVNTALDFAREYGVAVVLKCATTVVAFPNGNVYINSIGNSGMATAGSGDALAGIIGAETARNQDFEAAVVNGVYLHSAAGDKAADDLGKRYMCAMDIVDNLKYF